jgi:hypothetical protein
MENDSDWYAVRCVFLLGWPPEFAGRTYEERITLWRAKSGAHAIERAEEEALRHADTIVGSPSRYLGLAQAYHLYDEPKDGAEIFSLCRVSELAPTVYLNQFFDTGDERQRDV